MVKSASSDVTDALGDVPREPVLAENSIVLDQVLQHLVETANGWHFGPAWHYWRIERRFMIGFAVPFSLVFAGVFSWCLHDVGIARTWTVAILAGTLLTAVSVGSAFGLSWTLQHWQYDRLVSLEIPRGGDLLDLERPMPGDARDPLKYGPLGNPARQQVQLLRSRLIAVQLCPWKFVVDKSRYTGSVKAVQGLLVLSGDKADQIERVPILLTSETHGAAKLLRRLADVLEVPFLFHAGAAGWQEEESRAKTRLPLSSGAIKR